MLAYSSLMMEVSNMRLLNTLLVDDEESALEGLCLRLQSFSDVNIVGQASSVDEAIELTKEEVPDLVFLDIEMPGKSGFELLKQFQPENYPAVIFMTAYHQYAIKAFEVRALDYILKPVNQSRLAEAIDRARESIVSKQIAIKSSGLSVGLAQDAKNTHIDSICNDKLVIRDGVGPVNLVPFDEVYWVDAAGDYMCVHTKSETYVMRERMKNLENIVPPYFQRIHKSTMVNVKFIERLDPLRNSEFHVHLGNGKVLKASRTFSKNLKKHFLG